MANAQKKLFVVLNLTEFLEEQKPINHETKFHALNKQTTLHTDFTRTEESMRVECAAKFQMNATLD